jgi:hypothetical protein
MILKIQVSCFLQPQYDHLPEIATVMMEYYIYFQKLFKKPLIRGILKTKSIP